MLLKGGGVGDKGIGEEPMGVVPRFGVGRD